VFRSVEEIPAGYYAEVRERVDKPVSVTEIGWAADQETAGWESDDAEQAEFVRWFTERMKPISPRLLIWSFVFDQSGAPKPFDTSGFFDSAGNARPAWQAWLEGWQG
jgi:hypothetical protein